MRLCYIVILIVFLLFGVFEGGAFEPSCHDVDVDEPVATDTAAVRVRIYDSKVRLKALLLGVEAADRRVNFDRDAVDVVELPSLHLSGPLSEAVRLSKELVAADGLLDLTFVLADVCSEPIATIFKVPDSTLLYVLVATRYENIEIVRPLSDLLLRKVLVALTQAYLFLVADCGISLVGFELCHDACYALSVVLLAHLNHLLLITKHFDQVFRNLQKILVTKIFLRIILRPATVRDIAQVHRIAVAIPVFSGNFAQESQGQLRLINLLAEARIVQFFVRLLPKFEHTRADASAG